MLMHRAFLLLGLCLAIPARAGILEDDEARHQIKEQEARVLKLQDTVQEHMFTQSGDAREPVWGPHL